MEIDTTVMEKWGEERGAGKRSQRKY